MLRKIELLPGIQIWLVIDAVTIRIALYLLDQQQDWSSALVSRETKAIRPLCIIGGFIKTKKERPEGKKNVSQRTGLVKRLKL